MSDDYLERSNFLNRIASLQRLCSDHDGNYPKALLFVAGQDGRYNKGSVTVLKYLLRGSVGKELFDETLDPQYEALEDIILPCPAVICISSLDVSVASIYLFMMLIKVSLPFV